MDTASALRGAGEPLSSPPERHLLIVHLSDQVASGEATEPSIDVAPLRARLRTLRAELRTPRMSQAAVQAVLMELAELVGLPADGVENPAWPTVRWLIEQCPIGMLVAQRDDPIRLFGNASARALFGGVCAQTLQHHDFSPACLTRPLAGPEDGKSGLERALEGVSDEEEWLVITPQGERHLRATCTPIRDPTGKLWGSMACLHEITVDASPPALCLTSHELQSPLTVIKGYAEQLLWAQQHGQPLALEAALQAITRQTERMQRLITDVLTLSAEQARPLALERREVEMCPLIARVLDELFVTNRRPVERRLTPHVRLHGDPLRLEQVLYNLLDNAFKYSPPASPVSVTLTGDEAQVTLSVHNEGEGIPADELPHVFDPFYRARAARTGREAGGFGIGLALCRHIVELHGGVVQVESTPGAGVTFSVQLPCR
ncbi:MAG TPA: PAS domain-containing sensor histidine kinase [Armatimonadota bacterium]